MDRTGSGQREEKDEQYGFRIERKEGWIGQVQDREKKEGWIGRVQGREKRRMNRTGSGQGEKKDGQDGFMQGERNERRMFDLLEGSEHRRSAG